MVSRAAEMLVIVFVLLLFPGVPIATVVSLHFNRWDFFGLLMLVLVALGIFLPWTPSMWIMAAVTAVIMAGYGSLRCYLVRRFPPD